MNYCYETLVLILLSILLYVFWSFKKAHSFFEQNGIPYLKPNFFFGNMIDAILLRKSLPQVYLDIYKRLAPNKIGGVYFIKKPIIVVRDPEVIRNVLVKDFAYFHNRSINVNPEIEPLGNNLFNMKDDEWRNLRIKLTGTFTTGKMKMMFPLIKECGEKLNQVIDQTRYDESFDAKDLAARFTTDSIGTCAFGLETGALDDPNSQFREMGRRIFKFRIQAVLRTLWPNISPIFIKLFKLSFIEEKVQDFFINIAEKNLQYREQQKVTRYDFLDLLISLKNNTTVEKFHDIGEVEDLQKFLEQIGDKRIKSNIDMSNELIAAQCFVFFAAGFETSSTTLGYCLLELSQNQEMQDKIREEIGTVLEHNDGNLTYEAMKQMTYTDMVIAETLRKYPPGGVLFRECSENYKLQGTKIVIPEKTSIIIPVYALHLDENYYDNPEEFRPERFTEEEKAKRRNYTYIPFGEGPRVCIAERFAKMQIKVGLIFMLKDYSYKLSPKTKFPIEFEKSFGLLAAKNGIWLQREKI